MTVFMVLIITGVTMVSTGVYNSSIILMLLGRVIYGLGGDSLLVSQWGYITEFFTKNEIGVAFAIKNLFVKLAEKANVDFNPDFFLKLGIFATFNMAAILCWVGLGSRALLLLVEKKHKPKEHLTLFQKSKKSNDNDSGEARQEEIRKKRRTWCCCLPTKEAIKEDIAMYKTFFCLLVFGMIGMASQIGFTEISSKLLESQWFKDLPTAEITEEISKINTIVNYISTSSVLAVGFLADKLKMYTPIAIVSPIYLSAVYALSMYVKPAISFSMFGVGQSLTQVSLWTCMSQILPQNKILVSTGLAVSLQNAILTGIQYVNALLLHFTGDYKFVIYFYLGLNLIGFYGAILYVKNKTELERITAEIDKKVLIEMK